MMSYKKIFFLTILVFLVLSFNKVSLFAYITGSPHDFSGLSNGHNEGEVCNVCHTPHGAGSTEVPLWRGNWMSGWSGTEAAYTLYSSDTLDATVNQPLAPSKACLTCHDGSIAIDQANNCFDCHKTFSNSKNTILSNDHPVSFVFDASLAQKDGALHDPSAATVSSLGGKTIKEAMLYQNRLECTSCHDVHATKGDSALAPHLLLVDNSQDKLCLTCHNK